MKHIDHGYDLEVVSMLRVLAEFHDRSRPLHFQPAGKYLLDGERYHSRPEAACGYLLQRYCAGFQIIPGRTFQVPVGVGSGGDLQTIDFRHGEFFLEYHPPRIHHRHSKKGKKESHKLRRLRGMLRKSGLPPHVRERTYARLRGHLTRRYLARRLRILSESPIVEDFTLLVLGSPEELYRDFLEPYGGKTLPPVKTFLSQFKSLLKEVRDLQLTSS